jgi:Fe2+ or Zn2+ uptake regulation protein
MSACQRRNTRQRQVVLEELRATCSHPTAGELYHAVRDRMPRISLGTVYRNLDILQETGDVVRLAGCVGQEARYDGNPEPHLHLQCQQCHRVCDLDTVLPVLDDLVGSTLEGHAIDGYHVILRGVCRHCRNGS